MRRTVGILAHVDAGKTTFSEQALYRLGAIRAAGRVDHGDSFLNLHQDIRTSPPRWSARCPRWTSRC